MEAPVGPWFREGSKRLLVWGVGMEQKLLDELTLVVVVEQEVIPAALTVGAVPRAAFHFITYNLGLSSAGF